MAGVLHSMTGFGAANGRLSDRLEATVRLTSLNGRFLEVSVRTQPRLELDDLEAGLRRVLAARLERGRVQVLIHLQVTAAAGTTTRYHWEVAEGLVEELARNASRLGLAPLSLSDLLGLPGFSEGGGLALEEAEHTRVLELVAEARDGLLVMREQEAAALLPQIHADLAVLASFCDWLRTINADLATALLERLRERLAVLLQGVAVPDDRLLVEAAVLADRADVSEEVTRLAAHLEHFDRLLEQGGAVGKKLDFLVQEMLREVNTSASKCREAGMGEHVVEAKAALEKLREQLANLE
jgi:uncharacterized protein (TIGR00255 family)